MKDFLKKYKYVILINVFMFIAFLSVQIVIKLFGIDDYRANTYIFQPNNTFIDNIMNIVHRTEWNNRIGEIVYFIFGCFPRWIYFLYNGLQFILFFNLVYFYVYGKKFKEYITTKKYPITLFTSFILTVTLFKGFGEVFIWMAGTFNHLFDLITLLLCAIPYRLMYDDVYILKGKKVIIPYFIISFFAGLTLEHTVPVIMLYEFSILLFKHIQKEKTLKNFIKKNYINIIGMFLTGIGYLILIIGASVRINFFSTQSWTRINNFSGYLIKELYRMFKVLMVLIAINIIVNYNKIKEIIKDMRLHTFNIILGVLTLVIIRYTKSYYSGRVSFYIWFTLIVASSYLINKIDENYKSKYLPILSSIVVIFLVILLRFVYTDFNEFNEIRIDYMRKQYKNGSLDIICPYYDNKYNIPFSKGLVRHEDLICDQTYIQEIFKNEDIKVYPIEFDIR